MRVSRLCSMVVLALHGWGCNGDCPVGVPPLDAGRDADSVTDAAGTDAGAPRPGWVISIGGEGADEIWSVIPDAAGDLVISGRFSDTASFGTKTLTASGMTAFVAKIDPHGAFRWVTPLTGVPQQTRLEWDGLAVDPSSGNIYFAGELTSSASLGATTLVSEGAEDIVVVKLDPNGAILQAVSVGGAGTDAACAIAVGPDHQLTLGGRFSGTVRFGATELSAKGLSDGLVARLDADLRFVWATQAGSEDASTTDNVTALALDLSGNTYITGATGPHASFGELYLGGTLGARTVFSAKLDPAGSFLWVGRPALTIYGTDIVLDGLGNLFVASVFRYPDQPLLYSNASTRVSRGSAQHPGQAWEAPLSAPIVHGNKLLAEGQGGATLAGHFTGTLYLGSRPYTANKPPNWTEMNAFLARIDAKGKVVSGEQITTTGWTTATGLARDAKGNLYVSGAFQGSADFGGRTLTSTGPMYGDGFLWKREREQ